jgi:multicomponent Na+:H+ antiporter subunit F
MFTIISIIILVVMIIALIRAILGPTLYDRILAVNVVGTKTVLLLSVLSVTAGRGDMVDIALVYALINFISVIAVLRFFEYNKEQQTDVEQQ